MISALLAFFTAIPSIVGGVTAFTTAFYNAKVEITKAKIGGDVTVARSIVTEAAVEQHVAASRLKTIAGSRGLMFLIIGFALPWMIYEWKVVFIDNVVGPGSFLWWSWIGETDVIHGAVGDWATTIIVSIFGSSTTLALGHMWFTRPDK